MASTPIYIENDSRSNEIRKQTIDLIPKSHKTYKQAVVWRQNQAIVKSGQSRALEWIVLLLNLGCSCDGVLNQGNHQNRPNILISRTELLKK